MDSSYYRLWRSVQHVSVLALSVIILYCGFSSNRWRVAGDYFFLTHRRTMETFIVGRLVKSRHDGILSAGGLTGLVTPTPARGLPFAPRTTAFQYEAYNKGARFRGYGPYYSQVGGQAMLFSLLDRLMRGPPEARLRRFHIVTSLLSALTLALIALWFSLEFGLCVAAFALASMFLSQWLVVFGANLWWCTWAFFLPMLALMYLLRAQEARSRYHFAAVGTCAFTAVLVKCFLNGYEYITTTLVMMCVPLFYYGCKNRMGIRHFTKGFIRSVGASFLAIFLSVGILCLQVAWVTGSTWSGVEHVVHALRKRTHADSKDLPGAYAAGLEATTGDVVRTYLNGTFADLGRRGLQGRLAPRRELLNVRYGELIVIFAAVSLFVVWRDWRDTASRVKRRNIALVFATWVSILAPLSWFVLFKAHSFIHVHMNYIVWQMPFTIFGFAVCGVALQGLWRGWGWRVREGC